MADIRSEVTMISMIFGCFFAYLPAFKLDITAVACL